MKKNIKIGLNVIKNFTGLKLFLIFESGSNRRKIKAKLNATYLHINVYYLSKYYQDIFKITSLYIILKFTQISRRTNRRTTKWLLRKY